MLHTFKMAAGENGTRKKTEKGKFKKKFKGQWKGAGNKLSTGNKQRGHAFVEARKRKALKEYKKLLKKSREEHSAEQGVLESEKRTLSSEVVVSDAQAVQRHRCDGGESESTNKRKRKSVTRFTAAEQEFKKTKQERIQQIKEREEERKTRAELQKEKLKQRRQNFNRHNRRTRKGQPVMATQIEHLLRKIQT